MKIIFLKDITAVIVKIEEKDPYGDSSYPFTFSIVTNKRNYWLGA
jgi:hypothetical protein